jgi:hypothetical protein
MGGMLVMMVVMMVGRRKGRTGKHQQQQRSEEYFLHGQNGSRPWTAANERTQDESKQERGQGEAFRSGISVNWEPYEQTGPFPTSRPQTLLF